MKIIMYESFFKLDTKYVAYMFAHLMIFLHYVVEPPDTHFVLYLNHAKHVKYMYENMRIYFFNNFLVSL